MSPKDWRPNAKITPERPKSLTVTFDLTLGLNHRKKQRPLNRANSRAESREWGSPKMVPTNVRRRDGSDQYPARFLARTPREAQWNVLKFFGTSQKPPRARRVKEAAACARAAGGATTGRHGYPRSHHMIVRKLPRGTPSRTASLCEQLQVYCRDFSMKKP